jgi:hypothetical protein
MTTTFCPRLQRSPMTRRHHVAEVPDLRAVADDGTVVDEADW